MKAKLVSSIIGKALMFLIIMFMVAESHSKEKNVQSVKFNKTEEMNHLSNNEIAKLTKYEVKPGYEKQFRKVLADYVAHSLTEDGNIMSEAYYEQDKPSVLWLMERWENKERLKDITKSTQAKALLSLEKEALVQPSKQYYLKDLEPLTKEQWRRTAKKEDDQLIVVLFVDAKIGTQQNFKTIYHEAMPKFRSELGVVTYQLSEIEGNETQFVTYEKFRSNEAFQYHLKFPPIKPVIEYLETSIQKPPFQNGLHNLIEFAPLTRE
jgi:quinol monooxygenase YgiN